MRFYRNNFDRKDFSSGLFFLSLGLFLTLGWKEDSIWSRVGPEEGFFPLVSGLIIMGCSLLIILRSLFFTGEHKSEKAMEEQEKTETNIFSVCSYIILAVGLYGSLMGALGFVITSALFLFLTLRYVEKQTWKLTILLASASITILYIIFSYFLGVQLPKGFIF